MNIESFRDILANDGLSNSLGIEYISTPDASSCEARMKATEHNTQPFGFLSGGASLALAETLAGVGSCALCPGQICVGMTVQANHIRSAMKGETVTAKATIIHRGKTTHVWNVDINNQEGELVSRVSVTNYICPQSSTNKEKE